MASSLEGNKILAAILTAGIIASGSGVLSRILYAPKMPAESAYLVALPDAPAPIEPRPPEPLGVRLADASAEAGERVFRQCAACHTVEQGGAARVGPPLWEVLGRDVAAVGGFGYSAALQGIEGEWTYDKLDHFLENPRGWAPGTSMAFAGLRRPEDRAAMLLYLRSLAAEPQPLPDVEG